MDGGTESVWYGEKVSWGKLRLPFFPIVASRHGRRSDTVAVAGTGGDPMDFSCGDWLLLLPDARGNFASSLSATIWSHKTQFALSLAPLRSIGSSLRVSFQTLNTIHHAVLVSSTQGWRRMVLLLLLLLGVAATWSRTLSKMRDLRSSPFQPEVWNRNHGSKEDGEYKSGSIVLLTILSLLMLLLSPFSVHGWFDDNFFHVHPHSIYKDPMLRTAQILSMFALVLTFGGVAIVMGLAVMIVLHKSHGVPAWGKFSGISPPPWPQSCRSWT